MTRSGDVHGWAEPLHRYWQDHRIPFLAALGLNLLAFGYLFFTYIYSNHLFPNALDLGFPSFRTELEGRWGADIIYRLQGGHGIPLLDLMLAVPIQIANGLLFARLFAIRDPLRLFLAATLISIHPFVSDYYAFAGDHLVLVLGDSLILLAFHVVRRQPTAWWTVAAAAFLFQAALSCYQPKIGLIATLWVLLLLGRLAAWDGTAASLKRDAREMLLHGIAIGLGAALYMLMLKTIQWWMDDPAAGSAHAAMRLSTVALPEMLHQARWVIGLARQTLFETDFFGWRLRRLPGLLLLLFTLAVFVRAWMIARPRGLALAVTAALVLALAALPLALYAPFVISHEAYVAGRTLIPLVYLLAFLIVLPLTPGWPRLVRWAVLLIALCIGYRFALINAETGHLAHLRSTYELHFVNRLATRIEQLPGFSRNGPYALVVIGQTPAPELLSLNIQTHSNLSKPMFDWYRHVEILNFALGTDRLTYPDRIQLKHALEYAHQTDVWPGENSVTMLGNDMIVVVLEPPHDDIVTTMTKD